MTEKANRDSRVADYPGLAASFLGGSAQTQRLSRGKLLYKFTSDGLVRTNGTISEFWTDTERSPLGDGLGVALERAGILNVSPSDFARARMAVCKDWNGLADLVIARLEVDVYAFVGRCARQPYYSPEAKKEHEEYKSVEWIGGGWQVVIPGLIKGDMVEVKRVRVSEMLAQQ